MTLHLTRDEWDRIAADGEGVLFREGIECDSDAHPMYCRCIPPAEFVEAAQPCETCENTGIVDAWVNGPGDVTVRRCPDCIDGLRRIAVVVPCDEPDIRRYEDMGWHASRGCEESGCKGTGFVTVGHVVVKWGPLVVHDRDALLYGDGLAVEWQPHITVDEYGTALVCQRDTRYTDDWDEQPITLPPDVDPQSLVGQYALGIKVDDQ